MDMQRLPCEGAPGVGGGHVCAGRWGCVMVWADSGDGNISDKESLYFVNFDDMNTIEYSCSTLISFVRGVGAT